MDLITVTTKKDNKPLYCKAEGCSSKVFKITKNGEICNTTECIECFAIMNPANLYHKFHKVRPNTIKRYNLDPKNKGYLSTFPDRPNVFEKYFPDAEKPFSSDKKEPYAKEPSLNELLNTRFKIIKEWCDIQEDLNKQHSKDYKMLNELIFYLREDIGKVRKKNKRDNLFNISCIILLSISLILLKIFL